MSGINELSLPAEAARYLFGNLVLVREADLSSPTPCEGWDLRRLLRHVCASLAEVADVLVRRDLESGGPCRTRRYGSRRRTAAPDRRLSARGGIGAEGGPTV